MYGLEIDRNSGLTLTQQLYHQLRQRILSGQLPAGSRLPSTRILSGQLQIARNVAIEVYEQLQLEGFLDSRPGSYTCVARGTLLPESLPPAAALPAKAAPSDGMIDFQPGVPDLRQFPRKFWRKELSRAMLDVPDSLLGYGDPAGCPELRALLPAFLFQSRGVRCSAEQIVVTAGSTQALALAVRLLTAATPDILVENPLNEQMQRYLASLGCRLTPLEVDRQGLQTELLTECETLTPAFTLVTPSHQFPTGGILSVQRRIQLVQFARRTASYIVEDDYENEFSLGGSPVSSLQGLAPDTVLYIGTFSKTLAPALRLGYLVMPPALTEKFQSTDWFSPQQPSLLDQLALQNFIANGRLNLHIAKMNKLYKKKHLCIAQELTRRFGKHISFPVSGAGLHLTVAFPGLSFTPALADEIAARHRVRIYPVICHAVGHVNPLWLHQIILGYGNLTEPQISEGITRLSQALAPLLL